MDDYMDNGPKTFGEVFKTEREKRQDTLAHVAHELKIRESILESFEQMRFEEFPPEGYAQGMISSYARYLGLDPTEMLDQYRDELAVYQNRLNAAAPERSGRRGLRQKDSQGAKGSQGSRSAKRTPNRLDDSGTPPIASGRAAVATGKERAELPWKLMLVIAAAILVIGLGIWGLFSLFSKSDETPPPPITSEETSPTPTNETVPSEEDTAGVQGESTQDETDSKPFEVEISVADGKTSWIEVTDVDGDRGYVGSLVGPDSKKYTVTDSTEIIVGKPSAVTITRDGKEVDIPTSSGTGKVKLSIDDEVTQE